MGEVRMRQEIELTADERRIVQALEGGWLFRSFAGPLQLVEGARAGDRSSSGPGGGGATGTRGPWAGSAHVWPRARGGRVRATLLDRRWEAAAALVERGRVEAWVHPDDRVRRVVVDVVLRVPPGTAHLVRAVLGGWVARMAGYARDNFELLWATGADRIVLREPMLREG